MNIITAFIMAVIYNFGNMFGLYTVHFLVEASKFFDTQVITAIIQSE